MTTTRLNGVELHHETVGDGPRLVDRWVATLLAFHAAIATSGHGATA